MKKYSTLLFDADNTLLDFDFAEKQAVKKLCEQFNINYTEEHGKQYSVINQALWKRLEKGLITRDVLKIRRFQQFAEYLGTDADPEKMADCYINALSECGKIIPGADELCLKLSRHYDMHIITNGLAVVQKRRLAECGLLKYFSGYFISEETGSQKPEKQFFNYVLSRIPEKDKSKICIIGDSLSSDILGGINSGIDTCFFSPSKQTDIPYQPTYQVADYKEITEIF